MLLLTHVPMLVFFVGQNDIISHYDPSPNLIWTCSSAWVEMTLVVRFWLVCTLCAFFVCFVVELCPLCWCFEKCPTQPASRNWLETVFHFITHRDQGRQITHKDCICLNGKFQLFSSKHFMVFKRIDPRPLTPHPFSSALNISRLTYFGHRSTEK